MEFCRRPIQVLRRKSGNSPKVRIDSFALVAHRRGPTVGGPRTTRSWHRSSSNPRRNSAHRCAECKEAGDVSFGRCVKFCINSGGKVQGGCGNMGKGLDGPKSHNTRQCHAELTTPSPPCALIAVLCSVCPWTSSWISTQTS